MPYTGTEVIVICAHAVSRDIKQYSEAKALQIHWTYTAHKSN